MFACQYYDYFLNEITETTIAKYQTISVKTLKRNEIRMGNCQFSVGD